MSTVNPFDLLGDDETDDPSLLIAAQEQKIAAKKPTAPAPAPAAGKLPTKPLPPAQAVKEAKSNAAPARGSAAAGRGGPGRGRGGGRGFGEPRQNRDYRNSNGFAREFNNNISGSDSTAVAVGGEEAGDGGKLERGPRPRQPYRSRHSGYNGGDVGDDSGRGTRRVYDRRSGTGRGYGLKREGAGRGNWGTATDEPGVQENEERQNTEERVAVSEKGAEQEDAPVATEEATKDKEGDATNEGEDKEKEPEDKEMTLEEYEKIREEKRKALLALKAEERKVQIDKDLQSMQLLSLKKNNDDVFIKLGADKDSKKKETPEEKAKKSVSINEFLKPAEGERFYGGRGRGRGGGRGRGERSAFRGDYGARGSAAAPSIADQQQFPTLGGK